MPFIKGLDIWSFGMYLFLLSVKVVLFIPCVYILVLSWRGYPAPAMCSWVGGVVTCLSKDSGHRELRWGLWFLLSVIHQKHEEPHDSSESQNKHTTVLENRERQTYDCSHLRKPMLSLRRRLLELTISSAVQQVWTDAAATRCKLLDYQLLNIALYIYTKKRLSILKPSWLSQGRSLRVKAQWQNCWSRKKNYHQTSDIN